MTVPFRQVDVFGAEPYLGNPVAVFADADGFSDDEMQRLARWTNLSETTFVLTPTTSEADYRVRIFTPTEELPFAGHPTLGTAHAWLEGGGVPQRAGVVVQECGVGLVEVRRGEQLAFKAPALKRSGEPTQAELLRALEALDLTADEIVTAAWVDNGPGWLAVQLPDVGAVLAVRPRVDLMLGLSLGVVAVRDAASAASTGTAIEVRGFFDSFEDPVTGSLNASVAQWLQAAGVLPERYVSAQGTAMGRRGRVHVSREGGDVWVGGATWTVLSGTAMLPTGLAALDSD